MTVSAPLPFEIVSQPDQLENAVHDIAGSTALALDTESNSLHRYPEQLCLIQIATQNKLYILDTIALTDLSPLRPILEDSAIQKVVHGADYDIRCLDRHHGLHIHQLFDSSVAARFAGLTEFGLSALIKNLLGLTILKSEKLQQADWGRRPLSAEALEYAAGDVFHIFALREVLERKLQELGRTDWVAEECARLEEVRYSAPNLQTAFFSVKGAQSLDAAGLAVLRSLYLFRDTESRRQGRPPFFIIPDFALIALAANPLADLAKVPGLGQIGLQRFGPGLQQALREGQSAAPIQRPPVTFERLNQLQSTRLGRLKAWRSALSVTLALDPSLIWPTPSLERLAKAPATFEDEITSTTIRRWQRELFASALKANL